MRSLKQEFDALQKYTRLANKHWNDCIVASCLPAEILAIIFAFAQGVWKPRPTSDPLTGYPTYDLGWIYVSHVCSSWREVGSFCFARMRCLTRTLA